MLKKIISVVLTFLVLISSPCVASYALNNSTSSIKSHILSHTSGSDSNFRVKNGVLTAYFGNDVNVIIPDDLGITKIGDNAFDECDILSVTVPSGVTSIGICAFMNCTHLKSVAIPKSVKSIGASAFLGTEIPYAIFINDGTTLCYVPEDVKRYDIPDTVKEISAGAFNNCENLKSITIPSTVVSIGDDAFANCSDLQTVTFKGKLDKVGDEMFRDSGVRSTVLVNSGSVLCYVPSDTKTYKIPGTVTEITGGAFAECDKLKSITIPSTVKAIGDDAFANCSDLQTVTFKGKLDKIGDDVFGNTGIKSAVLVNSGSILCYVPSGAKTYKIPDSVTTITGEAFSGCKKLTSLTIPKTVTFIGDDAFSCCTALKSITIPKSITSIKEGDFYDCTSLKSIKISDSVTSIGESSFENCESLKAISIPNSVKSIGDDAFYECSSLKSVTLPKNINCLSNFLFYGCSSLRSITIPSSVTEIGASAFQGCKKLSKIKISGNVKTIGDDAFDDVACASVIFANNRKTLCHVPTNKTAYTVPATVTKIAGGAFCDCKKIKKITIPGSVAYIGGWAFQNCKRLTSVVIPSGVKFLGRYVFLYCKDLQSVTIPDGITSIGEGTFYGCSELKKISLPDTVVSIGSGAFYGCKNLRKTALPRNVQYIGDEAFTNCTNLDTVTIPRSTTNIEDGVFDGCKYVTLFVENGSAAMSYARENGLKYKVGSPVPTTKLKISTAFITIGVGEQYTIKVNIQPKTSTDRLSWHSNAPSIVSVGKNGEIKGKKQGTAKITVTATSGKSAVCTIAVKAAPKSISLNYASKTLKVGEKIDLNSHISHGAGCYKRIYVSSNKQVATVSSSGVVTAKSNGTATITCETYNKKRAACKITVE